MQQQQASITTPQNTVSHPQAEPGSNFARLVAAMPTLNLFVVKNKISVDLLEPVLELALAGEPEGPFFSV